MPDKQLSGMGPQEFIDATAKDGSLDSPEMLQQLSAKIIGIHDGISQQRDEYDAEWDRVEKAYGRADCEQESRFMHHAHAACEAGMADMDKAEDDFLHKVRDIEKQLGGLSSNSEHGPFTPEAIKNLGPKYAVIVDQETGTSAGSDRLKAVTESLNQQHVSEALDKAIIESLDGAKSKSDMVKAHADIYKTLGAADGLTEKKAVELPSEAVMKRLSQSGYDDTVARIEGRQAGSGVAAFFSKFKAPIQDGTATRIYLSGMSKSEQAAHDAGKAELAAMRKAGSPETVVQELDKGELVDNGIGSVRVPTSHVDDVKRALSQEPIYGQKDEHGYAASWGYGPKVEPAAEKESSAPSQADRALPSSVPEPGTSAPTPDFGPGT